MDDDSDIEIVFIQYFEKANKKLCESQGFFLSQILKFIGSLDVLQIFTNQWTVANEDVL